MAWLWMFHESATGAYVRVRHAAVEDAARGLAHSPAEMLSVVRAHLSLSMVEVAAALEVERPTIYAWLAGRSEPQERNRKRLHRLFEVARRWGRLSKSPLGARLRHPDEYGTSLLDLIRSGRFEEAEGRLDALARVRPVEEQARKAPSIQEILARHGLEERIRPSREEIDRLTGKRSAPE
jgi:transcriptional regulator with XRE-family HTH domain